MGSVKTMYTFESRVRYSETEADGRLSVTGIINYLQDCSTFQSEDLGVGIWYLKQRKKVWMLSSWKIEILRRPAFGEKITVGTWPYEFKGIYGYRNFVIWDEKGIEIVKADSTWFLCDLETGHPQRVREEDVAAYGANEPRLDMKPVPRKIALPDSFHEQAQIQVSAHHIDTNHHVNNAQYIELAREARSEKQEIRELRAEYKKAAVLGDILIPRVGMQDGEEIVALCNEEGQPYAVVAFKTQDR